MIGEASLLTDQLCHVWWQMWPSVVMNGSLRNPYCKKIFVFHLLLHTAHSVKRDAVSFPHRARVVRASEQAVRTSRQNKPISRWRAWGGRMTPKLLSRAVVVGCEADAPQGCGACG
jgi:hypothetical protein